VGVPGTAKRSARPTWLTRNVTVLSGVSFLQDAASELLYPILPIFLTVTLGAPVAVVGLVEGLAEGAAALTKLLSGALSDRMPRRRLVALGYGLAAVGKLLIALATAWPVVLAGRGVDRLGKGIRGAPRDALLVQGVPVHERGRVFGFHRTADTAGAVVGPLIGLAGYALLDHRIRPLLVIAVVPAVLSALLVAAIREQPRIAATAPDKPRPAGSVRPPRPGWRTLPADYRRLVGVLALFSLVNFPDALLLLRLHEIGFTVTGVVAAYVLYNLSYAGLSYPAGLLADRWSRRGVYTAGLACFAVAYLGLGLTESKGAAVALLLVYGGFTALTDGVGKAWISSLVPDSVQGHAQGLFQGAVSAAVLVAGVWAGLAWNGTGALPLLISGAVATVLALGFALTPAVSRR
jgi:MFS family permease